VLARALHDTGHEVIVLSRRQLSLPWRVTGWDGETPGAWHADIDGSDVVINLAGRSVNCRYTDRSRAAILESRVKSTRAVGNAVRLARRPPRVWLQASTATIYAHRYDEGNDELTGVIGGHEPDAPRAWRFSIDVARTWEAALAECATPATRKLALRSALIMSPEPGGIFASLLGLVRLGLGGAAGDGRQFVSWIHYEDFVRAVRWLIDRKDLEGVVNVASPHPLPNAAFMRVLREAAGMPLGAPATRWMLAVGAAILRTEIELVLKSRRVIPRRLVESGFSFQYLHWADAAPALVDEWRRGRSRKEAA
jgi:uncharacterized protein (TIGR01777 family)